MTVLTEKQTQQILDGAFEQIKQTVIDEVTQRAAWDVDTAVSSVVKEVVSGFIKEEVAPEILTSLREKKSVLINAAIASAEDMAVQLAKALSATLAENLGKNYQRKKILEAMFG